MFSRLSLVALIVWLTCGIVAGEDLQLPRSEWEEAIKKNTEQQIENLTLAIKNRRALIAKGGGPPSKKGETKQEIQAINRQMLARFESDLAEAKKNGSPPTIDADKFNVGQIGIPHIAYPKPKTVRINGGAGGAYRVLPKGPEPLEVEVVRVIDAANVVVVRPEPALYGLPDPKTQLWLKMDTTGLEPKKKFVVKNPLKVIGQREWGDYVIFVLQFFADK